ncbi:MmgE/PrpD family protein [compost metagenome]
MELDLEVDRAYPQQWLGRVQVTTTDGRVFLGKCDEPKGDPGNTLSRLELEEKFRRLLGFSEARTPDQINLLIARVWALQSTDNLSTLLE